MTSSSQQLTSERPFHHFEVEHPPDSVDGIPAEALKNFSRRLDAAMPNKFVDAFLVMLMVISMVVIMLMNIIQHGDKNIPQHADKYILLAFVCFFISSSFHSYLNARSLKKLQQICKDEESTSLSGYTVECHNEFSEPGKTPFLPDVYSIYMFPNTSARIGRIEVAKDPILSRSVVSPSLPTYNSIPIGIPTSVSVKDWSSFWTRVDSIANTYVTQCRHLCAIVLFFLLCMLMDMVLTKGSVVFIILYVVIAAVGCYTGICYLQINRMDSEVYNLCKEFSSQQNDLVVEYHKERDWSKTYWWVGTSHIAVRRSIWLYPKPRSH